MIKKINKTFLKNFKVIFKFLINLIRFLKKNSKSQKKYHIKVINQINCNKYW